MPGKFNPLADITNFLGGIAQALPPLPPPPFPLPHPPSVEPSSGRVDAHSYVDVTDEVTERQMKRHRAEQAAKGIIVLDYE